MWYGGGDGARYVGKKAGVVITIMSIAIDIMCPQCEGTGRMEKPTYYKGLTWHGPCDMCCGEGRIYVADVHTDGGEAE